MNAHHPIWGGLGTRIDNNAEKLLEIAIEWDLEMTTEQGKPTWSQNDQSSVIDLTFISSSLTGRLMHCERADDIEHASNHFPRRGTGWNRGLISAFARETSVLTSFLDR